MIADENRTEALNSTMYCGTLVPSILVNASWTAVVLNGVTSGDSPPPFLSSQLLAPPWSTTYRFVTILWLTYSLSSILRQTCPPRFLINNTFRRRSAFSCSDRRQIAGPVKDIWAEGSQKRGQLELNKITGAIPLPHCRRLVGTRDS